MWHAELPGGLPALAGIDRPVLVLQGAEEEIIRHDHAAAIAAAIPGGELVVLPGVGHVAPLQDPAGFTAAIRAFLDRN